MATRLLDFWKTFQAAAGIRAPIFGLLVSLLIATFDRISRKLNELGLLPQHAPEQIFGYPTWLFGLLCALALIVYWMWQYANKLRVQIEVARKKLAELRREGVALRNRGLLAFASQADLASWEKQTEDWHRDVCAAISEISIADSIWFETMDVVPSPRVLLHNQFNQVSHPKRYNEHDFQVRRLGEMVRDLWGK